MNTQSCQDCSVIVQCIAHGEYPHHLAPCQKCKGIYPVTTIASQRHPPPTAYGSSHFQGLDLSEIGPQVQILNNCPKHTLLIKQIWEAAVAQHFLCRNCSAELHVLLQVPEEWQ